MKLTSKFRPVKLGCGMTIGASINEYNVLRIRIPNFAQTTNVSRGAANILISPDSIAGLERILKAFKAASKGHEEA